MKDEQIIQLYWERNQQAIFATSQKYENYCKTIAKRILGNSEDVEECLNDTWLNAWNSIPPHKPEILSAFLGKLTRNLAFNRYKYLQAKRRGGGELTVVLDELNDCLSGIDSVEQTLDRKLLLEAIHTFLEELPKEKRQLFLCRYWYAASIEELAKRFGKKEGTISVMLNRIRTSLKQYLTERGFTL